jgi:hypothetical protein
MTGMNHGATSDKLKSAYPSQKYTSDTEQATCTNNNFVTLRLTKK